MHEIFHILEEALLNSVMITGLVVIMMMMIESLNIESHGTFFKALTQSRVGSVIVGALLGVTPGCLGGFATVSLYTHGILSFGALVAMMIASSGDEAFIMLAMIPSDAMWIFTLLFVVAVVSGVLVDIFVKKRDSMHCDQHYDVHQEDEAENSPIRGERHFGWKRVLMFTGIALFLVALVGGLLEHEHGEDVELAEKTVAGINLLSEDWMNMLFSVFSIAVLCLLVFASDHFVDEHLWHHVVVKHLPGIFAWTFGVLIGVGVLLEYFDIAGWVTENTFIMIILATLVGLIPESGPHLVFVTLYASGIVPLPVLLASCISQDGHASLPLIAESKMSFVRAKLVNCAVALLVGGVAMIFCN